MQNLVFGNSNAEFDDLLLPCVIQHHSPDAHKSILTGRWGTGKTALVLLDGQETAKRLRMAGCQNDRLWYIKEQSLDLASLLNVEQQFSNPINHNDEFLRRTLESAWRSEIVRTYSRVLYALSPHYKNARGAHWDYIAMIAKTGGPVMSTWKQLPMIVTILLGNADRGKAADEIQRGLEAMLSAQAIESVQSCLLDIDVNNGEHVPVIVIEPIETPTSPIEAKTHLADDLIASLLNVFHKYFQPTPANRFNVRITLPWHRYDPIHLDFPQKLPQYIGRIRWTSKTLRAFINKRIEYEFKRVKRHFVAKPGRDAWVELFGETIVNGLCRPKVYEDSFHYFLRHTHHRARDLQHLARRAVEHQADDHDFSVDDVLRGPNPISPNAIKEIFRSEGPQITEELLIEASRRFPEIMLVKEHLRGLSIPFSLDDLKKRVVNSAVPGVDVNRALDMLWSAGVIGVTAVPKTLEARELLFAFLPDDSHRSYTNDAGQQFDRWCWFEYNDASTAARLLDRLSNIKDVSSGLILHSKTLEYFGPHSVDTSSPIGV